MPRAAHPRTCTCATRPGSALPWNRFCQSAGSGAQSCTVSWTLPSDRGNPRSRRACTKAGSSASARSRTPTCRSRTSLASRPGTLVEPMWSTRTARWPRPRSRRCTSRSRLRRPRPVVRGPGSAPPGGVARRPCSRLSLNGTSRSCHSASTWSSELRGRAVVVQPHVGGGTALLVVGLGGDPRPGVGLGQPARGISRYTRVASSASHHDDEVVGRAEVLLDQQRHVVHDDRLGAAPARPARRSGPRTSGWVIGSRSRAGRGVGEHQGAERGPVQRTVGSEDLRAEAPPRPRRGRGVPGATTSRASRSASTTTAPSSPSGARRWTCPSRCRR